MSRTSIFILISFILLAACTPAPTATPAPTNTPLPTATLQPTNTPLPTATATATATPTLTETPKPTATATAIATFTPNSVTIRTVMGEVIEVPIGVAQPPDLSTQQASFDWQVNLDDAVNRYFPPDLSLSGSTKTQIQTDPTGVGMGRVFTSEILDSIAPNGGLLGDGMHRAYVSMRNNNELDGKCWTGAAIIEVDIFVDQNQVDLSVDSLNHKVLSIGGSMLVKGDITHFDTKLLPQNGGYGIVPVSFPANSRQATTGRILSEEAIIRLKTWTRVRTILANQGIWIMIGRLNIDHQVDKWVVESFTTNQQPNVADCRFHFGPYAEYGISSFKMYQTENRIRIFGQSLPR